MSELSALMTELVMVESPRWHDGRLWFSDWGARQLIAVDLEGRSEVVLEMPSMPFCFDWLPDGRLLVVSGGESRVLCREHDGSLTTYADLSGVSTHPWNEIVVDQQGNAYVNCINFEFPYGEFQPGVIALVTPDGSVTQVADNVAFPNGMALTPDGSTLIVAESYADRLTAFDVTPNATLTNRRIWAALPDGAAPDGICLAADGTIWYASVPKQQCVHIREGGEILQPSTSTAAPSPAP
ncbi:SMP-30/gluconolactonase/LRE family protein [Kribbella sp. NBC_01245]|uniref:SMP-30/gluconolactonase/LRE family protein n=1 Tax=Kribbella sp. NBC_01245 TaxID=2903578 RepID=UPI002E28F95E|nr:SMP-30/gluconolactonase/LRE family protein [Kribbella sp. NBC_01245]